jgi:hypothetical protein
MLYKSRFRRKITIYALLAVLFVSLVSASGNPSRLDLYDASDNHLMFMTFQYNEAGLNTGREVFMSDETFMRRVAINYNSEGKRISEVSYNFNEDTSWVMRYQHEEATGFSIVDQFKMDYVGGMVNYTPGADQLNFDLTYQKTGGAAARMEYEKEGDGNLRKVSVLDQSGAMQYYGVFRYEGEGVKSPKLGGAKGASQAVVKPRGGSVIEVSFNLRTAGEVRCDLITLSGRHAGTLLRDKMEEGIQKRSFRFDGKAFRGIAGGVYIFVVSIDGVTVSRSRYLHQHQGLGGVR